MANSAKIGESGETRDRRTDRTTPRDSRSPHDRDLSHSAPLRRTDPHQIRPRPQAGIGQSSAHDGQRQQTEGRGKTSHYDSSSLEDEICPSNPPMSRNVNLFLTISKRVIRQNVGGVTPSQTCRARGCRSGRHRAIAYSGALNDGSYGPLDGSLHYRQQCNKSCTSHWNPRFEQGSEVCLHHYWNLKIVVTVGIWIAFESQMQILYFEWRYYLLCTMGCRALDRNLTEATL